MSPDSACAYASVSRSSSAATRCSSAPRSSDPVPGQGPSSKAARAVRRVMAAGIKAEGPIHADRLAKLTVNAFGLNRSSEARKKTLLSLLPPSAVVDGYLWPEGISPDTFTGFRRQASSTRSIDR